MANNNVQFLAIRNVQFTGSLWENFIISERRKQLSYLQKKVQFYFWRTYTGAEIDYVEESEDGLAGFEIKMSKNSIRMPRLWKDECQGVFTLLTGTTTSICCWKGCVNYQIALSCCALLVNLQRINHRTSNYLMA